MSSVKLVQFAFPRMPHEENKLHVFVRPNFMLSEKCVSGGLQDVGSKPAVHGV